MQDQKYNVLETIDELMEQGYSEEEAMKAVPYYANYNVPVEDQSDDYDNGL